MNQKLDWINLYRAALREADPGKRAALIQEAETAMKSALRIAVEEGDSDQRHAISEALHHLGRLREASE